jgi:hypothetical protein
MLRIVILTLAFAATAALGTAMNANPAYAYKVGDCMGGDRLLASNQWVHDKTCPQKKNNIKPNGSNTPK